MNVSWPVVSIDTKYTNIPQAALQHAPSTTLENGRAGCSPHAIYSWAIIMKGYVKHYINLYSSHVCKC